jgi:hypothetical protein
MALLPHKTKYNAFVCIIQMIRKSCNVSKLPHQIPCFLTDLQVAQTQVLDLVLQYAQNGHCSIINSKHILSRTIKLDFRKLRI